MKPERQAQIQAEVNMPHNQIMKGLNGEPSLLAPCEELLTALTELRAELAAIRVAAVKVMSLLEKHGGSIVPHLMDTDDNAGQELRELIAGSDKG